MARISYIGDNGEALEIHVGPENPDVMVGRHRTCGIRTANQSVSREHSRVFFDGESYWLQDNDSRNGTFYQNIQLEPQTPVQIANGEFLMCGNFEVRFDFDEEDEARMAGGNDYEPADDPDSTRFANAEWEYAPPPPPPPPVAPPPPPPPPPPVAAPPPPVPNRTTGANNPPPPPVAAVAGRGHEPDAAMIEDLRATVAQRNRDLEERDSKINGLRIELDSLSRRLSESQDDVQRQRMQVELEQLRVLPNELRELSDQLNEVQDEAQKLRNRIVGLENENARVQSDLLHAEQLAQDAQHGGSRAEDEAHIATLEQELSALRESLSAAQEKFEEARAGRRNAEELASLQRMRADQSEPQMQSMRSEITQLKRDLQAALANASASADMVSTDEYDAQVMARDEAEEKAFKLQNDLNAAKTALTTAQNELAAKGAVIAELTAKVAAGGSGPVVGADPAEAARLRVQLKAEKTRTADIQAELAALKATGGGGGASAGDGAGNAASLAELAAANAQIAGLKAQLAAAAAGGGASGDLEAEVAKFRVQLKAEKSRAADAVEDAAAAKAELITAQADLAKARADLAAGGGGSAAGAGDSAGLAAAQAEVAKLLTSNRELEASQSANMKRIQKLIKDADEARGAGAANQTGGGDALALARAQAELATVKSALAAAEARAAAGGGAGGGTAPKVPMAALHKLVSELNGVVSSFRNDFMTVTDGFEQARSEDATDRDEGFEMLQEGLDACGARNGELKNIIRDLKIALDGSES